MPYDDPDPEDPSMLVGVVLPGNIEAVREMAAAFADEFAAMGYDEARIWGLFQQPFYAAAFQALKSLGEGTIRELIREGVNFWGRRRIIIQDGSSAASVDSSPRHDRIDVPLSSIHRPKPDKEKSCQ